MAIDFKKFNEEFGGKEAVEALAAAKQNEYKEVTDGEYVCKLESLELAASKAGKPMIKGTFRICYWRIGIKRSRKVAWIS